MEEYAKTGRKMTKLICNKCNLEKVFDHRKREKQLLKFKKHVRECKG